MVTVLNRKDQCCIWLFSDLVIFTSIKRKSGPVSRKSTLLQSPSGQDFIENSKHKVWLKLSIVDFEIVKMPSSLGRRQLVDRDQLEEDFELLGQISEMADRLKCPHQSLDDGIRELLNLVNKQLSEHQLKSPPPDATKVELLATTPEGIMNVTAVFSSPEKKMSWETAFNDAKQKIVTASDSKPPEFMQALQITKTRAGMQFSCAAPIDGLNASQHRDVWVCNSDGYVGHMCLLSLQPEPIVTLNTPVPGCNSRILCICAVPGIHSFKRKGSARKPTAQTNIVAPSIKVSLSTEESEESSSSDEDEEELTLSLKSEDFSSSPEQSSLGDQDPPGGEGKSDASIDPSQQADNPLLDPLKGTMWLGTEDGCIHVFLSTDNIKTTKNKIKLQQSAGVLCVVHLDHKVFVSLANGDLIVYRRNEDDIWNVEDAQTVTIGSATTPVNKMLAVAGKLWCACHQELLVLNPSTLDIETRFIGNPESRMIQCMACSGHSVWLAGQGSSKVLLYHATSFEHLLEVNIAQAVAHKLQTADDIIRQHKTACLRITTLLTCKDLLWVGTSAGVLLTIPMPKVSSTTCPSSLTQPTVTGLVHGHTGHVRFLTSIDLPSGTMRLCDQDASRQKAAPLLPMNRRASISINTLTLASRMLVISGGDGYEDFRNNSNNEAAGRDDSTNHLLLWQV